MSGYWAVSVLVDGVSESERLIMDGEDALGVWAAGFLAGFYSPDALAVVVEVYRVRHDHAVDVEDCSCVRYAVDHRAWMSSRVAGWGVE